MRLKIIILMALFISYHASGVNAQTLDSNVWQQQAAGLKLKTHYTVKVADPQDPQQIRYPYNVLETGGLGFTVIQGPVNIPSFYTEQIYGPWPFLMLPFSNRWIQLGHVNVPGATGALSSEVADWAHNEMTYNAGQTSQVKLTLSRLTPAILVNSSSQSLSFFTGNLERSYRISDTTVNRPQTLAPSNPKYAAFSQGGTIRIQPLSTTAASISPDQNWMLVWYGGNSHFVDSRVPRYSMSPFWEFPWSSIYQADVPILFVFENLPNGVQNSTEGGVQFNFASATARNVAVLPLYGKDTQNSTVTEGWSGGLPAGVNQKIQFWRQRLCQFPTTASETYGYNPINDTASITEAFTYTQICLGGTKFAPIPPFLGIVKDNLNVQFSSPTITDGNLTTDFGPTLGFDNTDSYAWNITGLNKYTDEKRIVVSTGTPPSELVTELDSQINKLTASGHMAPWVFIDDGFLASRGDLYWANSADTLYHLTETAYALSDTNPVKTSLINYIRSERTNYPPEGVNASDLQSKINKSYNLDIFIGKPRGNFILTGGSVGYSWRDGAIDPACPDCRGDAIQKRVPLYSFFPLSRYYELTNDPVTPASWLWTRAKSVLDADMKEQDWATSFWFKGFSDRKVAVINSQRHMAGLIGFIKLARMAGDTSSENLGRVLLAKAAVQRLAMAKYPRFLDSNNLIVLPTDTNPLNTNWQPVRFGGGIWGHIANYNWTNANDDARQVALVNETGVYLNDTASFMTYTYDDAPSSFGINNYLNLRDITPEVARFLTDYAKQDLDIYIRKSQDLWPHWYAAFNEATLGTEHNLTYPTDPFQIFMAKAWIDAETPQNLQKYLDIPWLSEGGDLFYMQKLAETVKAYKGVTWEVIPGASGTPPPVPSPTPTSIPHCQPLGNINCIDQVNVLDLSILISKFGSSDFASDLNDSGKVNVIDLSILLSNFGNNPSLPAPVGSWKFDEVSGTTVSDSSGSGNNGSWLGTGTHWGLGHLGGGAVFNGTDDYVNLTDLNSLDNASQFTITAWFKRSVLNGYVYIASKGSVNTARVELAALNDGNIYFDVRNGSTAGAYVANNDTSWHHAALVYDGTQTTNATRMKGYIDGVAQTLTFSGTIPTTSANNAGNLLTGRIEVFNIFSTGNVDELKIYNYPLTPAQVVSDMNGG